MSPAKRKTDTNNIPTQLINMLITPVIITFILVWKKVVTKKQAKFLVRLANFIEECERFYDLKTVYSDTIKMKHVKNFTRNFML